MPEPQAGAARRGAAPDAARAVQGRLGRPNASAVCATARGTTSGIARTSRVQPVRRYRRAPWCRRSPHNRCLSTSASRFPMVPQLSAHRRPAAAPRPSHSHEKGRTNIVKRSEQTCRRHALPPHFAPPLFCKLVVVVTAYQKICVVLQQSRFPLPLFLLPAALALALLLFLLRTPPPQMSVTDYDYER
eukprot:scaffold22073_cov95-Isochrysis_galbana.AAC.2